MIEPMFSVETCGDRWMVLKSGQKEPVSYHDTSAKSHSAAYIYESCYLAGAATRDAEVKALREALEKVSGVLDNPRWDTIENGPRAMLDWCIARANNALATKGAGQ